MSEEAGKSENRMGKEEAIAQLKDLIRDRKSFIDKNEPNSVFQDDIDALTYAVDFMESRPRDGAHSWFYTFGTDPEFPFGIEEFVEVHADTPSRANKKFMARFPCREGSTLINCAWVYPEAEWEKVYNEHYSGKRPAIIID